jgi:ribokinase
VNRFIANLDRFNADDPGLIVPKSRVAGRRKVKSEKGRNIVVIGSANMDLVVPVDRLPRAGETISGGDLGFFTGGKGANQACAASKLGGAVWMVAQVGRDPFGALLVSSLEQAGVLTEHIGRSERPTGCALIQVLPDGENAIVVSPGANATLDPESAVSRLASVKDVGFVLSQLEIPLETVEAALASAKLQGAVTILDPAPARWLSCSLLRSVDLLTPNQSEAAVLLGEPTWQIRDFSDAEEAASRLLALGPSAVVLKLGALGCLVASAEGCHRVPAFQVPAVDTTAAGDAFNGAFAVALAEGFPVTEAAVFSNASGALSVMRPGAQASLPGRDEVDHFLSKPTPVRV